MEKIGISLIVTAMLFIGTACHKKTATSRFTGAAGEVRLVMLNPGHFHAWLLQADAIPQVNDTVWVYAPEGGELEQYLSNIEAFNRRAENPTSWQETVYKGSDFLAKMLAEKKGNVVVLAGNNAQKTEYIRQSIDAGLNVLSDKPMAINAADFDQLSEAYQTAKTKNVLLYDMMTERYDLLNIVEKELMNNPALFGALEAGTAEQPAVWMESVHHFYKEAAGKPLIRPAWYYDVEQQGEGIADVTTHLIDLVFWKCFPEQSLDYKADISDIAAEHWATNITPAQFTRSTGAAAFPDYLQKYVRDGVLQVDANGIVRFSVKNHAVSLKVIWNDQAPAGGGDTFASEIRGTKAVLKTVQNKEQQFVKELYVEKSENISHSEFQANLEAAITALQKQYPFISLENAGGKHRVVIPVEHREGHEAHFRRVANQYFQYLVDGNIPEWEISTTLAKYYITTQAVARAKEGDGHPNK